MVQAVETRGIYRKLVQTYGVFAERLTDMDLFLNTEAYPDGSAPGISLVFGVGKIGVSTFINVYFDANAETKIRVGLRFTHEDYRGKDYCIYTNQHVDGALEKGFMENKIFEAMAQIDKTYVDRERVVKTFLSKNRLNLADTADVFQKLTNTYGIATLRMNNYKRGDNVGVQLSLGDSTGRKGYNATGDFSLASSVPSIRGYLEGMIKTGVSTYKYNKPVYKI